MQKNIKKIVNKTINSADGFCVKTNTEENNMVHPGMVGITELMMDDSFLSWMEVQEEELLETLSTFEIFKLYQKAQ
jgi:hypothetical protein